MSYLSHLEVVAELRALARGGTRRAYLWMTYRLLELEAPMDHPERREHLTLRDLLLCSLLEHGGVMDAPAPADALVLDTSYLNLQEAARWIGAFAAAVSGLTRHVAEWADAV